MRVAVIDIGSNTIKLLVAARAPASHTLETIHFAVEETRLGGGLGQAEPRLAPDSVDRACHAIERLVALSRAHAAERCVLVATSAVRDAANGGEFVARVHNATGLSVRILTGDEEANYIGRGLAADPALAGAHNFYLFDLGGGSLECLEFRERRVTQAVSARLGCVRLTERCVAAPAGPFTPDDRARVVAAVQAGFGTKSPREEPVFRFALPAPATAVATGGTVTTVRAMLAAETGAPLAAAGATVRMDDLERLLAVAAGRDLAGRRALPGLPAARADVFPTALATIIEVARLAGVRELAHSYYNLRYGVADELLAGGP